MVVVDGSSLKADSQPKLVDLVLVLAATRRSLHPPDEMGVPLCELQLCYGAKIVQVLSLTLLLYPFLCHFQIKQY